jgi:hypothetical protein
MDADVRAFVIGVGQDIVGRFPKDQLGVRPEPSPDEAAHLAHFSFVSRVE